MNAKDHEIFDDLCAMHAFDALDGEDRRRFEEHIRECPMCEEHLREYREASNALPLSAAAPEPSPALRDRIQGITRLRQMSRFRLAAAAAVLLVVALGTFVAIRESTVSDFDDIMKTPAVMLEGRGESYKGCLVCVHWKQGTTRVVVCSDKFPVPPPGKKYQLWCFLGKEPFPCGVFTPEADGCLKARADLSQPMTRSDMFAITLEDRYQESPKGEIVMVPQSK